MKILLVNPRNPAHDYYTVIPNISLGYLAASLRLAGHDVEILDAVKEKYTYEDFAAHIQRKKYDVIGSNCFTPAFNAARMYSEIIVSRRNGNGGPLSLIGGPHAVFEPEDTLKMMPNVDFAFWGEAEKGLPELLRVAEAQTGGEITRLRTDESLKSCLASIPNLAWRDGDKIICNKKEFIDNLDENGIQAWDLIRPETYPVAPNGIFSKSNRIAPIITTRGCPYPCTFCGAPRSLGKKIRERSMDNILEELLWLKKDFGIQEVHLLDDNFTFDKEFAMNFSRMLIENNLNLHWACPNGVRLDTLDEELLNVMDESGCYSFAVGIESGSQRILTLMKKHLTVEKIREQIHLIKNCSKIKVTGFFIVGYPGETEEEVRQTVKFAMELGLDRANFFNFSPFPGSTDYTRLKESGELHNVNFDDLYIHSIGFSAGPISKERMGELQREAHLRFYFRPRILWGILREIRSMDQLNIIFRRVLAILLPNTSTSGKFVKKILNGLSPRAFHKRFLQFSRA